MKNEIVTLSEEELMRFYKKDLSNNPRLERVRDLFCFATFTGQRWSDIENFRKDDVKDGWWVFESYKTKKITKMPLKGFIAPALDILRKYDYELPKISSQKFNDYIKEAGSLAEINETVTIKRLSGNQRIKIKRPKHEFMSSHMARRSCVTILLQRGMPPTTVMKLTGHTDLKTLMKYENTGDDALVKALEVFKD
ncbi:MAG: integrase catalytic domain-containing protein [Vallitaleaceae bacterium]|nr:integrase catalytic domain-containing protein [Vallitaleaceae bacterium]